MYDMVCCAPDTSDYYYSSGGAGRTDRYSIFNIYMLRLCNVWCNDQ